MMPNLGQGGCQAIEDGFVLTDLLCSIDDKSQLKGVLQEYYRKRIVRSAIIQGMSRLSSDIIITSFSTPFKFSGTTKRKSMSRYPSIHPMASFTSSSKCYFPHVLTHAFFLKNRIRQGGTQIQIPYSTVNPDMVLKGISSLHLLCPIWVSILLRAIIV
jgi:2-polyprenyl-6-methoxyphenol hydroxylase-like FAD-dependent oxidoreductase